MLCDQNYQFAELASLRRRGVRTIGRFVWEHFTADHVDAAREAFDVVYSLTQRRAGALPGDGPRDAVRAMGVSSGADRRRRARERRASSRERS